MCARVCVCIALVYCAHVSFFFRKPRNTRRSILFRHTSGVPKNFRESSRVEKKIKRMDLRVPAFEEEGVIDP